MWMQRLAFVKAALIYGDAAQRKDTAHNARTAPEQHGQPDPKDVFAVNFWLHQVRQDSLNQHVNGPYSKRQAGSNHVYVVQNTFLGKESTACTEPGFILNSRTMFFCKPLALHPLSYLLTPQATQFWNVLVLQFFLETPHRVSWKPAPASPLCCCFC